MTSYLTLECSRQVWYSQWGHMVTYITSVFSPIALSPVVSPSTVHVHYPLLSSPLVTRVELGGSYILYLHFNMWPCNHLSRSICWCQFLFYSVLCWMPPSPPCSPIWLMLLLLQSRQDSMRETATSGVSGCWQSECMSHTLAATVDSVQRFMETASQKIKALLLGYPGLITTLVSYN